MEKHSLPRLFPKVGDKKWNGDLYTEADIALINAGRNNMLEGFKGLFKQAKIFNQRKWEKIMKSK